MESLPEIANATRSNAGTNRDMKIAEKAFRMPRCLSTGFFTERSNTWVKEKRTRKTLIIQDWIECFCSVNGVERYLSDWTARYIDHVIVDEIGIRKNMNDKDYGRRRLR